MKAKDLLKTLIETQKIESFKVEHWDEVTDEEALGVLVSHFCNWNGIKIVKTFDAALEDANFHRWAADVKKVTINKDPRHDKIEA